VEYYIQLTQSVLYSHLHHTRTRLNSHWIASVRCPLLTFSHLNLSPPTYHQRSRIYIHRLTYNNGCHGLSVTDASNPKNNYIKNDRLQYIKLLCHVLVLIRHLRVVYKLCKLKLWIIKW